MLRSEKSRGVQNFVCPRCAWEGEGGDDDGDDEGPGLVVNWGVLEEVRQFCYLGDVMDCEGGVERAVQARVPAAWRRWQEIASLLVNRSIGLRTRKRVYETYLRSALLYGAETRVLTSRLMGVYADVMAGCWDTWKKWGGKMGGLAVRW